VVSLNSVTNTNPTLDLLKVNVNAHTEKKNGLTYLSWAWAWDQILRADPQANYDVKMFGDSPYLRIGDSAMVWVSVTVFGKTLTVQLPVLDYRNKCIANPNAFDINTSIMRCLTKGIAMHGLGLYVYAGEDLPMDDKPEDKPEPVTVYPVDKETGEIKAEAKLDTGNEDANSRLFAKGMIQFTEICTDVKGLNSYWKANQPQLDKLKVSHPELYEDVRGVFAALKKKFSTKE
jgi:hypothetical protein